jgi:hypothetical protein
VISAPGARSGSFRFEVGGGRRLVYSGLRLELSSCVDPVTCAIDSVDALTAPAEGSVFFWGGARLRAPHRGRRRNRRRRAHRGSADDVRREMRDREVPDGVVVTGGTATRGDVFGFDAGSYRTSVPVASGGSFCMTAPEFEFGGEVLARLEVGCAEGHAGHRFHLLPGRLGFLRGHGADPVRRSARADHRDLRRRRLQRHQAARGSIVGSRVRAHGLRRRPRHFSTPFARATPDAVTASFAARPGHWDMTALEARVLDGTEGFGAIFASSPPFGGEIASGEQAAIDVSFAPAWLRHRVPRRSSPRAAHRSDARQRGIDGSLMAVDLRSRGPVQQWDGAWASAATSCRPGKTFDIPLNPTGDYLLLHDADVGAWYDEAQQRYSTL